MEHPLGVSQDSVVLNVPFDILDQIFSGQDTILNILNCLSFIGLKKVRI